MFEDKRSKRVVLVIHCILNQNARIDNCAYYPGPMTDILQVLSEAGVGIVQMPCPELQCLGLDRAGRICEGRDIGIREALLGPARGACEALVEGVLRDVLEYRKHGFEVLGVIGNDGSPACGVDFTHHLETYFGPGEGGFIQILRERLEKAGIALPFVATQDFEWEERLPRIRAMVEGEACA